MKKLFISTSIILITILALVTPFPKEVIAADYYASININDSLNEFSSDLTSLLTTTHNYKSYGSSYNPVLARGAAVSPGSSDMELFYTGFIDTASNAGGGNQNDWNKEHVWPKSQTGGESSRPANDIHNIRPTNTKVNSTRSNKPFNEDFGGSIAQSPHGYGPGSSYSYTSSSYFEPRDEVKGDTARIIFYLLTRYESLNLNINTVGNMDMFLRWHYADPVDQYELNMNEEIYLFQGNRNPYIDHPEFVDKMYPNNYGTSFEELDSITLPATTITNLSLPAVAGSYPITWSSSDETVITKNGVITRDVQDKKVTLTATISKDGAIGSKKFDITVLKRDYTIEENMIYAQMKNSLEIEFSENGTTEQIQTAKTGAILNNDTHLNFNPGSNYASNFSLDDDIFELVEVSKTQTFGASFYKDETFSLRQGTVVKLASNLGNIKSIKVTYSSSSYAQTYLSATPTGGTELKDSVALDINSKEVYLIQVGTQARITSIEIDYSATTTSYNVNNVKFNFGFEFSKEVYEQIASSSNFEIGILYTKQNVVEISSLYNNENINTFIASNNLNKGDIVKHDNGDNYLFTTNLIQEDLSLNINACAYMVYDGKVYFSSTISRSVEDVLNIYIKDYATDSNVSIYIDLLKYLLRK